MRNWMLLSLLLVCPLVGYAAVNETVGQVPPGQHPRILCTPQEVAQIRARLQQPDMARLLQKFRQEAFGMRDEVIVKLESKDAAAIAEIRTAVVNDKRKPFNAALVYLLTGDPRDGRAAAELFRMWMSKYPPTEPIAPILDGWGDPENAMAFDWIYDQLSKEERARAVKIFAAMVSERARTALHQPDAWYFSGNCPSFRRSTNWTPICSSRLDLTNAVIEGEPGYNAKLHEECVEKIREFLFAGIEADGSMTEGVQYPMNYGTHFLPFELLALQRRGVDLIHTTHLSQVPLWFTYEMLPWGGEAQAINKSNGGYQSDTFTQFLSSQLGGLGDWVYLNSRGYAADQLPAYAPLALLTGLPQPGATRPDTLPLSHWFAGIGKVISRSGWGSRDAHFTFNTNPLASGHTHADHGSFTLAGNGVNFICDSGYGQYASIDHNIVHIDGVAQSQQENATESFIRSAELSGYADVVDADLHLAYDRSLVGPFEGPWHWEDYNPVAKAERQTLFVRGVSGPLAVVVDNIKKDDAVHEYDWLARTNDNNRITLDGRKFTIAERYGGSYIESIGEGQQCAFIGHNVPAGTYRGWFLVRGTPAYPRGWSNTTVALNGKTLSYSTTRFAVGGFSDGWWWSPILPNGEKGPAAFTLPAGNVRVDFTSVTGAQVALAVFTRDEQWTPNFDIPTNGGNFVVLGVENLQQGSNPWAVGSDPLGVLEGVFLGKDAPQLRTSIAVSTKYPVLHAVRNVSAAQYLCVLFPHEQGDGRSITLTDAQSAMVKSPDGVDLIAGSMDGTPTSGDLVTDAKAATVAIPNTGRVRGYAMSYGKSLNYQGRLLVLANSTLATVINDGERLLVRGPGGASVVCTSLTAKCVVFNGVESALPAAIGETIRLVIPRIPQSWAITTSDDGRVVDVTGDGPLPLKIPAPKAATVRVNGVERRFVFDAQHNAWPLMSNGSDCFRYPYEIALDDLPKALAPEKTKTARVTLPFSKAAAVQFPTGSATFNLNAPCPGRYSLTVTYATADAQAVQVQVGDVKQSWQGPTPNGGDAAIARVNDIVVSGRTVQLTLRGTKPFAVTSLRLTPVYQSLPANGWMTIGPFPSPWGQQRVNALVKAAMSTVFPPERGIDLTASYPGSNGQTVKWQHMESLDGAYMKIGVNFGITNGVTKDDVCYAVTYITSPEDRTAQLQFGCDYWANVYVNGELAQSDRAESAKQSDGAQFNSNNVFTAVIKLKKGVNTVLVKCQSGSGGSSFIAGITNPGDLKISPKLP